jgi:hypothetical protein
VIDAFAASPLTNSGRCVATSSSRSSLPCSSSIIAAVVVTTTLVREATSYIVLGLVGVPVGPQSVKP